MKIWPFDPYAEATQGHDISAAELERALEPFRQIRGAVGTRSTSWSSCTRSGMSRPRAGSWPR